MNRVIHPSLLLLLASCANRPPPPPAPVVAPAIAGSIEPIAARPTSSPMAPAPAEATAARAPLPYDLAGDLDERTGRLRRELGAKTRFEVVEGVFLVAAPSGNLRASASVGKTALRAYFNGRFSRKPDRAVAVLLFDGALPYDAYCQARWGGACTSPFGFYQRDDRLVVMNVAPGIGTLTHELVHPIMEADFPQAPDWINEGIASLYEAFGFPGPGEIRGEKNFRLPGLRRALRAKTGEASPSLPSLFAMSNGEFRGERESLNYATARYFCQWMDSQKKLWLFYRAWRDAFADDPTGEKAFVATMGKPPAALDASWVAWVRAL